MLRVRDEQERIAAALHHVVEDTNVTMAQLARAGLSDRVGGARCADKTER